MGINPTLTLDKKAIHKHEMVHECELHMGMNKCLD